MITKTGLIGLTAALVLAAVLLAWACATPAAPVLTPLRDTAAKTPVVLIPGITGSQLRDRETKRVVWGNGQRLVSPHDGGYSLVLPIGGAEDRLEPFAPVLEIRLAGLFRKRIYEPWIRLMRKNGYEPGDLRSPRPDESFFIFVYDWRHGNDRAAQELARQLEALRISRGEDRLRVTLICQSNAALIGRYFVKYGGLSLDRAAAGLASRPTGIEVDKLIMVGTSNGGALRVLHEMNEGRKYIPLIGRRTQPETMFTWPSLFESLPYYRRDLFLDTAGNLLDVDLYEADNWERYGWSIFSGPAEKRVARSGRKDLFGDEETRKRFLASALDRARLLHELLLADIGRQLPRYYSVQNTYTPTAERAVLVEGEEDWKTLFPDDKKVRRDSYLISLASSPGDGHATLESQQWLSPKERVALVQPTVYIEGGHFEIILDPATQRRVLEFLLE